jgi:hypothetical protein
MFPGWGQNFSEKFSFPEESTQPAGMPWCLTLGKILLVAFLKRLVAKGQSRVLSHFGSFSLD